MRGSWHFDRNRRIVINTEVIGGSPAPNTYVWRVQQPDGSFVHFSNDLENDLDLSNYIRYECYRAYKDNTEPSK